MKIAFFSDTYFPQINGVSRSIYNSSKELIKREHEVALFTYSGADNLEGISIYRYKIKKFFRYNDYALVIPNKRDIYKKLKEFNPDVIHIHTPTPMGYVALKYGRKNKIPIVSTYHTYLPGFLKYFPLPLIDKSKFVKKLTWILTMWFYNKCNFVIAPSKIIINELINKGLKVKNDVVSNGVDLKKFYVKKVPSKYKCNFIHVGRIGYEKNIDILLKAFSLVDKKTNFFIVGDGPDVENLKKLSHALGVGERVKFIGPKTGVELLNYYNGGEVFVTASTIETEGIVLLEAMACGKPIIGVNKLAIPLLVNNRRNGYITEPGDYKDFARYMSILYKNKKLRNKLGKNSLKDVKNYSVGKSVEKLIKIYSNLKK